MTHHCGVTGAKPDFKQWAAKYMLKEATIKVLIDEDLNNLSTLQLVDVGLLRTLNLTIGQRTVLEKAVKSLGGVFDHEFCPLQRSKLCVILDCVSFCGIMLVYRKCTCRLGVMN